MKDNRRSPDPKKPLMDEREEMFAQLRADRVPYRDAYLAAFQRKIKDSSAIQAGFRLSKTPHVKARIEGILAERRKTMMQLARKFEASREEVIAKAVVGWQMAFEKGDLMAMSRHNNDMANFARDSSWGNRVEVAHEGSIDQLLREVEEQGPFRPGEH